MKVYYDDINGELIPIQFDDMDLPVGEFLRSAYILLYDGGLPTIAQDEGEFNLKDLQHYRLNKMYKEVDIEIEPSSRVAYDDQYLDCYLVGNDKYGYRPLWCQPW